MKTLLAHKEQKIALGLILLAVATRLLPHPPNFAPITGIALFAAARFQRKYLAVLIPFLSLFLTDLLLGLSAITWFVYAGFGLILLLGFQTKKTGITTVLLSSVLFFCGIQPWCMGLALSSDTGRTHGLLYISHPIFHQYAVGRFGLHGRLIL